MRVEWRRLRDEQPEIESTVWYSASGAVGVALLAIEDTAILRPYGPYWFARPHMDKDDDPIFWAPMELPDPPTAAEIETVAEPRDRTAEVTRCIEGERRRQIELGYDTAHDNDHDAMELAEAALVYLRDYTLHRGPMSAINGPPNGWPWDADSYRPESPRSNLVRSAALIVAEIERIDREFEANAGRTFGELPEPPEATT